MISTDITVWATAITTIAVLSFLIRDNPLFRIAENMAIGITTGNAFVYALQLIQNSGLTPLMAGDYTLIVPIILGIALFLTFTKMPWGARYPTAFLAGTGTGIVIRGSIDGQFWGQIKGIAGSVDLTSPMGMVSSIVLVAGSIGAVSYFIYTREHNDG
jgi:hypothetical protein